MELGNYNQAYLDFLEAEKYLIEEWETTPESIKSISHWGNEYASQKFQLEIIRKKQKKAKIALKNIK